MSTAKDGGKKTAAEKVAPATGKLGVMVVGLGAVATTMIAGAEAVRCGLAKPIGSLTQMGTIRLGKRTDNKTPLVKDFVPLADLNDLVFTGWDIFEDNVYEAAAHAEVLDKPTLEKLKSYLEKIKPMPAVFDQHYVKRLHGTHVKKGKNKRDLAEQVMADIRNFKKTVDRVVMIWCGSTEIFLEPSAVHDIMMVVSPVNTDIPHQKRSSLQTCFLSTRVLILWRSKRDSLMIGSAQEQRQGSASFLNRLSRVENRDFPWHIQQFHRASLPLLQPCVERACS